jgi:hypothetical protein
MVLTWVFVTCLLNAQGACHAFIPQTNFAYLPLAEAEVKCKDLLRQSPGSGGTRNLCIKALQFDMTYGQGRG